jgi:hypothetical protein
MARQEASLIELDRERHHGGPTFVWMRSVFWSDSEISDAVAA